MVNNPEQPSDSPVAEEASAVVEEAVPTVEDDAVKKKAAPKKRATAKKRRVAAKRKTKTSDIPVVEVGQSPAEIGETLKKAGVEIKDRAKEAGMRPVREFYTSVASQAFSIVHGILDGLDPSKNKKGK
jgi:hypothetical protein